MLIDHYGDTICFTYPKDRRKSQMFYSVDIKCADVAESIRSTDVIKVCAEQLQEECKKYDFQLDETYNLAEDCDISYDTFTRNRPQGWVKFFDALFPYRIHSYPIQRKCDTIFQIFHYIMHNGKSHNPFHVSLAELLHDNSRAKLVIDILNKLGLCISYDEVQRTDFGLMNRIIDTAGSNRVPVSLPLHVDDKETEFFRKDDGGVTEPLETDEIRGDDNEETEPLGTDDNDETELCGEDDKEETDPLGIGDDDETELCGENDNEETEPLGIDDDDETELHGTMDNFDHDEATLSGIGGSHDTILMLFQNTNDVRRAQKVFSKKPTDSTQNQRTLDKVLPCQELIKMGKFSGRGKISKTFSPGNEIDYSWKENELNKQYTLWILARYHDDASTEYGPHVPSFAALKSLLDTSICSITHCAFTPILPYPATEFDTIFTTMINFQDVLQQRGRKSGPLWSDEGVYHIAKEIQLIYPEKFADIFLGIGGFHLEKVVIGCLGSYLECSGIQHQLVEEKVFGPAVVNSVMSGGNYIRGKRGISLIAEAMEQLQIGSFLKCSDGELYAELFQKIERLNNAMLANPTENKADFDRLWKDCLEELEQFDAAFTAFKVKGSIKSNLFAYWNNFLTNLAPVLRDLTRSFRDADWYLHLSSVSRSIDLCFSFDRINYKRWLPMYYEDCLALPERFPKMHNSFLKGDFVVRHTSRKGSAVPMDQALEKAYNKPAKSSAGIIGFTRRKEAVCKWNLIKHEKGKYRNFLYDICQMSDDDEYSLHHEFSERITLKDKASVAALMKNIKQRGNPFKLEESRDDMNIAWVQY